MTPDGPPDTLTRLAAADARRKHEAVERGGPGAIVFPDQSTAPRIARVCHGIRDHVHRWRELYGDSHVPLALQRLEAEAELLQLELGAALGVRPDLTASEANRVRQAVHHKEISDPGWGDEIIAGR